ncbi:WD40 repeat-like protein [Tuber magnatum]|uniref:WD40 repeat-like protein n=1 Tax=Tuber magnatum TaxID=42249 RepID=A0A317SJ21_9PEZI|nr:WD40 repeat-like protein [Tuber magnatum]
MITATTWVPRGFSAQFPERYDIDEKEFERIADLARLHLEDAKEDLQEAEAAGSDAHKGEEEEENGESNGSGAEAVDKDEDMKEVGDEKQKLSTAKVCLPSVYNSGCPLIDGFSGMGMFGNIKGLAYYQPGEQDPYITMDPQDDEEEREELQVLGTDNLLLVAKTEDDIAHLEVYVYEDEADNLYVHHDIMLPAIPLCVEWLDIPVGGTSNAENRDARGNYAAIGTMDPDIEIWNLDLVDCLFPNAILGAGSQPSPASVSKKKKNKKKKSPKVNDNYHIDAVLSLSGNRQHRNLLASASADKTVKLWDLSITKCAKSYNFLHTDKICALSWHPSSAATILSGSYDRTIVWSDMRSLDPASTNPRWGVDADVEDVRWDPHDDHYFYVSTESGNLYLYDSRSPPPASSLAQSKPVWTLNAHDKSLSAFDVNPIIPGFIVTASVDKSVKLWNARAENVGGGPAMVVARDFDLGKIFSARFAPDKEVGFRLAVAGSKGVVKIWDTSTNAGVRRVFAGRVAGAVGEAREEKVVGAAEDSSDGSDEEEGGGVAVEGGDESPDGWESMEE